MSLTVLVWITENTWPACVDAARTLTPAEADIVLLTVTDTSVPGTAHGAFTGLLGRGHHPERDPGRRIEHLADAAAQHLLEAAANRLGRPARLEHRHGRTEHEILTAAQTADLLVLARDGDRTHLGPRSIGPATRFVLDHTSCPVLLIWPEPAPASGPPPPPHHN